MAVQATDPQSYALGRGEIHFARFFTGTYNPKGERYIGNSPEFNLTIEQEVLDHFSSDHGIREKDESIALQVNRTGSFTTDNVVPDNVALFFFGEKTTVTEAGATITEEVLTEVEVGLTYQLGISTTRPAGAKGILGDTDDSNSGGVNPVVTIAADSNSVALVEDTDYTIDYELGRLYVMSGAGISDGDTLHVTYTIKPSTYSRVISGSQPVEGAMRYIAFNPVGDDIDYYFPWVKISPNGDYALKSDEWQAIPFSVEVLKRSDREAIYADGRPAFS